MTPDQFVQKYSAQMAFNPADFSGQVARMEAKMKADLALVIEGFRGFPLMRGVVTQNESHMLSETTIRHFKCSCGYETDLAEHADKHLMYVLRRDNLG